MILVTIEKSLRFWALLFCFLGAPLFANAQVQISFGPSPKALDNLSIWSFENGSIRQNWDRLRAAGVSTIVIHPTVLMRHDIQQRSEGGPPKRPQGTWATQTEFAGMHDLHTSGGFAFTYEAGVGLSGNRCDLVLRNPSAGGARAATVEFNNVLLPMLSAQPNGVPIREISVDGPFLRLIEGSQKNFSCSRSGVRRIGPLMAAQAVDSYLRQLTSLISNHPTQHGVELEVSLLINLPNWRVGKDYPRNTAPRPADMDLLLVLEKFNDVRRENGAFPQIKSFEIDYPYCVLESIAPCSEGGRTVQNERFVGKVQQLWAATRNANEPLKTAPGAEKHEPLFGVIVNTYGIANTCAKSYEEWPFFLPYRRCTASPSANNSCPLDAGWQDVPKWCQRKQQDEGQDLRFWNASQEYADRLTGPDGDLRQILMSPVSAGISSQWSEHLQSSSKPELIDRIAFRAWGKNPVMNVWYLDKVAGYAERVFRQQRNND